MVDFLETCKIRMAESQRCFQEAQQKLAVAQQRFAQAQQEFGAWQQAVAFEIRRQQQSQPPQPALNAAMVVSAATPTATAPAPPIAGTQSVTSPTFLLCYGFA